MASARDTQKILHAYVRHTGNPRLTFAMLEEFAARFAERFAETQPDLVPLKGEQRPQLLRDALAQLESSAMVTLDRDEHGAIASIYYPAFYATEITRAYSKIADNRDLPFPGNDSFPFTIPTSIYRSVDVTQSVMQWLVSEEASPHQILLLTFPDGVDDLFVTVKILRESFVPLLLHRIRSYLQTDRNGGYMETKLRSIFKTREGLVHELLETVQMRQEDALSTILEPNDFHLHFWTQLASIIVKDYAGKTEKIQAEHGFCQASYLLGYFVVFYKGKHQKEQDTEEVRRLLVARLRQPPYVFSLSDVYGFVDERGIELVKRSSREQINAWLEELLKRPNDQQISELVSITVGEDSGMMVHSGEYVPLLLNQVKAASAVFARSLSQAMYAVLIEDRREAWIDDNLAFERHVAMEVHREYPLLAGLATFQTLFLVIDGQELTPGMRDAALAVIDPQQRDIKDWTTILGLNREEIYRDARLRLPLWMLIPIIRGIVRLFRRKKRGAKPQPKSDSSSQESSAERTAQREKFRQAMAAMEKRYLSAGMTADQQLKQLRNQWNPLIEPKARENLVEDVNALCRDTLRRMRYARTLQVPDAARIDEMAQRIAGNSAFERIRDRKSFETYLKLYMISQLRRS